MRFAVEKNLPNEYTKLEYLESTGTQYIDTEIKSGVNLYIKTKFNLINVNAASVFGSYSGSPGSGGVGVFFGTAGGNLSGKVYCNNTDIAVRPDLVLSVNTDYEIEMSGTSLILNNSEYTAAATADNNYNMLLFARSNNGNVERNISGKIYYYKAYDNDTLVRDFIPALRKSDNVAGMYDRVTNTFFTNAGTGSFSYTKEEETVELLNNPKYKQVEYLESTGTQYIDADFKPNTNTRTVGRCYFNSWVSSSANYIFGVFESPNNYGFNVGSARQYFNVPWGSSSGIPLIGLIPQTNKDYDFDISKTGYLINGQSYGTISSESVNSTRNMYLFWANGTSASGMNGRIYYLKIYDNGVLVRNFIPVIRKEDNKPGMYDTVSGTFFENKGTGEFLTGRILDPLPAKYEELAYVESTGTQYIDTGVNFDCARTAIEVKTYETSLTQIHSIFGDNENNVYWFRGTNNWAVGYNKVVFKADSYITLGDNLFKLDKNNLYLNGNLVNTYTASTTVSSSNILLFNRKTPALDAGPTSIYYCRIWNDDVLVRDFVPCIRKSDNKVGMYDRVNGGFYTNLGTGNFTGVEKSRQKEKTVRLVKTVSNGDLPYGLTEVEYLESTGTQWIDTDIQTGVDIKTEYMFEANAFNSTTYCSALSARVSNQDSSISFGFNNVTTYISFGNNSENSVTPTIQLNTKYKIIQDKNHVYINDNVYDYHDTQTLTFSTTLKLYLFGRNNNGTFGNPLIGKIYYAKIYDNDTLVRDFVPVLDESNVPCMYDKVSKKCFYNKGTGNFTVGRKIYPVEYLETTNQQNNQSQTTNASWIDTGIIPTSSTKMECKTQFTTLISGTSTEALFGTTGSGVNPRFAFGYASVSPYRNFYVGLGAQNLTTSVVRDTNVHTFIIDAPNNSWSIDDTTGTFTSAGTLSNTNPICLFGRHTSDYEGINKPANAKTYYCKIWDNDVLTRDFIPAMDENQVGFMFDKVTHTIYDNKGTGTFSYGSKLNPFILRLIEDVS